MRDEAFQDKREQTLMDNIHYSIFKIYHKTCGGCR